MIPLSSIMLIVVAALLLTKHVTSQIPTQPHYLAKSCGSKYSVEAGNYTLNSTYHNSLSLVFSDLVSRARSGDRFFNTSSGTVYGQYYCRGDISTQLCQACIKAATLEASTQGGVCFPVRAGSLMFQECTLVYDYQSNVGIWDSTWTPGQSWSATNVSDPTTLYKVLTAAMDTLIKKAAYGGDPLHFATGDKTVTAFETVYCLVQCSPDITQSDCDGCLREGLRYMVENFFGLEWAMVFYFKCQMKYGLSLYYSSNSSAPPPVSPPLPPPVSPPLSPPTSTSGKDAKKNILIPVAAATGSILFLCGASLGLWFCLCRRNKKDETSSQSQYNPIGDARKDPEIGNIEYFDFRTIEEATMKFSLTNKLVEGGFGGVYKCMLSNGHLVAIKRLSGGSRQGIREFKTEVAVVAKLQHRNLVRLLGFCVENEERILVYEYLPNLSLDKFLFDQAKSFKLDWRTRYNIIEGITWGLRYLHIDSLLTIVHRDLKSSNILLDDDMNPKIADFGLAKLVNIDETAGNTSRIAGTFGYMAPEYAMAGRFSIKSDIYSFGVIILELISGKSISQFFDPINGDGLLHHAWKIWKEKTIERLLDPVLRHNYSKVQAERCLQIALLCVQDDSTSRPNIRLVGGMLENKSLELPYPSAPSNFFCSPETNVTGSDTRDGRSSQYSQGGFIDSSTGM